ncbi:lycopene cyclase domain-containing protein [Halorutilales archaeon Cl-col2-1]
MSYLAYVTVSVVGVSGVVAIVAWHRRGLRRLSDVLGVGVLSLIAVGYTFGWDAYLIYRDVWWYGDGVVSFRIVGVPAGEILFFVAQTSLTSFWLYSLKPDFGRSLGETEPDRHRDGFGLDPALVTVVLGGVSGLLLVFVAPQRYYYLGQILVWGAPMVFFLWYVGSEILRENIRLVVAGVAVPTVYLWGVDRAAIQRGLWTISEEHSTGIGLLGLPLEEMVFFGVTNSLVVFGLVLYLWVAERARDGEKEEDYLTGMRRLILGVRDGDGNTR